MDYIDFAGLGNFAAYFVIALVALLLFKYLIVLITPYDEWKLIKEAKNSAAAIALGGSLVGFSIAINGVLSNAVDYFDLAVWAFIALISQVVAIKIVRFVFMPKFVERINNNETGAAIVAAAMYISVGLINAGSMTY